MRRANALAKNRTLSKWKIMRTWSNPLTAYSTTVSHSFPVTRSLRHWAVSGRPGECQARDASARSGTFHQAGSSFSHFADVIACPTCPMQSLRSLQVLCFMVLHHPALFPFLLQFLHSRRRTSPFLHQPQVLQVWDQAARGPLSLLSQL